MTKILFYGKVQGVGFRPQVCRVARELSIFGFVRNLGDCVEVVVQNDEKLDEFLSAFYSTLPKEAKITQSIITTTRDQTSYNSFEILDSKISFSSNLKIELPQDLKICDKCIEDMQKNARFMGYGFGTCIDCGARYSIIEALPYDRSNTTMKNHHMCPMCKNDYQDQDSRRFHAEPISCKECAIKMVYKNSHGVEVISNEAFESCIRDLKNDKIVAFKGVGGFGLICKASVNNITRLRKLKKRERKPFALMVKDLIRALEYVELNTLEKQTLQSKLAPILLAKKRTNTKKEMVQIQQALAPDLARLGVILPYSALHILLLEALDFDIVFTSANFSGEPIITHEAQMSSYLGILCDSLLGYDREIFNGIDDSLVQVMGNEEIRWVQILRLARGYAPLHLCFDGLQSPSCFYTAKGAQERVNLAYRYDRDVVITPYIGDLTHPKVLNKYEDVDKKFLNFYQLQAKKREVVTDLHPQYYSSHLAQKEGFKIHKIQHHKAHFASIFADSILQDKSLDKEKQVLGIIWDGSGLGEDGKIWGGEFFYGNPLNDLCGIERIGHFKEMRIYGGESAAKEIYKLAFSLSLEEDLTFVQKRLLQRYPELDFLKQVYKIGFESSSCGRLFDIVACLCGLCDRQDYKAEGAMIMERYFDDTLTFSPYGFLIDENGVINLALMWREMLDDLFVDSNLKNLRNDLNAFYFVGDGNKQRVISRFIHTLSAIIEYFISQKYDANNGLCVMFSGGVFNNANLCSYLIEHLSLHFNMDKLKLYFHHFVPCGDEGISLGQVMAHKV